MDKSEYKLRAEEIKDLISRGEYAQAAEIADTIDWRRVKSVMMLCTISDLYKINRRYEDARDMLLLAYERRPGGRTICYSLCELSIKMEEYVQAIEYYKEFVQVAPKDPGRYILQYKLYEAQDVSLEERIAVLEELKKRDYREKWAYELAYLYHRVGLAARCVEECDELILWFGEGKYVIKAMELKMLHQPLTPEQQEKYDHRFDAPGTQQYSQNYAQDPGYGQNETYDPNQGYVQDGSYDPNQGYAQGGSYDPNQGYAQDGSYDPNQGYAQDGSYDSNPDNVQEGAYDQVIDDTRVYEPVQPQQAPAQPAEDDFDIHVKTMDVGQYNTINLQAELAAGLREVLSEDHAKETSDSITRSIVAPMIDPGIPIRSLWIIRRSQMSVKTIWSRRRSRWRARKYSLGRPENRRSVTGAPGRDGRDSAGRACCCKKNRCSTGAIRSTEDTGSTGNREGTGSTESTGSSRRATQGTGRCAGTGIRRSDQPGNAGGREH